VNQSTGNPQGIGAAIERVLIGGDLSQLGPEQKVSYYKNVCESLGLNALTQPFGYIRLNGKEVLYAKRECTEQLRTIHKVSLTITSREVMGDVYVVTAQAKTGERCDESTGAVTIKGLAGDNLANAYMKAETKAKRRVTLSICGLGLLDETEVASISNAVFPKQPQLDMPILKAGGFLSGTANSTHSIKVPDVTPKQTEAQSAGYKKQMNETSFVAPEVTPDDDDGEHAMGRDKNHAPKRHNDIPNEPPHRNLPPSFIPEVTPKMKAIFEKNETEEIKKAVQATPVAPPSDFESESPNPFEGEEPIYVNGNTLVFFGKNKGKSFSEIGAEGLEKSIWGAVKGLNEHSEWVDKVGRDNVETFVKQAKAYLQTKS